MMFRGMASGEHMFVHVKHCFGIPKNGSKRILNYIMCGWVFSPMNTMK